MIFVGHSSQKCVFFSFKLLVTITWIGLNPYGFLKQKHLLTNYKVS